MRVPLALLSFTALPGCREALDLRPLVPVDGAPAPAPLADGAPDAQLHTDPSPVADLRPVDLGPPSVAAQSCASTPGCGLGRQENCCRSPRVEGGAFLRGNDLAYPAMVGAYELDKFEVTVGRMRAFVASGYGTSATAPRLGAGAHPRIPQSGWRREWNERLPADRAALEQSFLGCEELSVWTPAPGANESLPMNCVDWYQALAFCIWDGGRLPTEAEWNFAAAGGPAQRMYPWGSEPPTLERASFDCRADGLAGCLLADILPAGHRPVGDGRWGHSDLAGSMSEWVLDWMDAYPTACHDCAITESANQRRVHRGGGFSNGAGVLTSYFRASALPENSHPNVGFRCVRSS